jgi:hypothetical protein
VKPYIFEFAPDGLASLEVEETPVKREETPVKREPETESAVAKAEPETKPAVAKPEREAKPAIEEPEPEAEPAAEEPPTEKQRLPLRLPRVRPVTVVLILALAAVSTFAIGQWRHAHDLSAQTAQRRAVEQSAGKVASTFFNWDYQHMQVSFTAKYALLTKSAADAIRPTAPTLTAYFTTNKAMSTVQINGIYPGEIKGEDAAVVVAVDTRVTTAASIQTNIGATLLISMKRVSGSWLANNISLTGTGKETYTDPQGKPITSPPTAGTRPSARPTVSPAP